MKAILVLDMPSDCAECQFCGFGGKNLEKYVCCLTGEHSEDSHLVGCPLRPLPTDKIGAYANSFAEDYISFTEGWDSYEKALIGETE